MKSHTLMIILYKIQKKSNFTSLLDYGYTYSQLAIIIQEMIQQEYLSLKNEELELTEKGVEKLDELLKEGGLKGKSRWILPQYSYRTEPIKKYDIILPKKIL